MGGMIPTTRSIIQFTGEGTLALNTVPCPAPGPGQVLIETRRSLISTGTEMTVFKRRFAPGTHWADWVKYPFDPGYLNAGVVVALGEGVEGWQVGDRIASRECHASHVVANVRLQGPSEGGPSLARPIPKDLSDDAACWMGLGKIVQVGVRAAEHVLGDVVVVIGLGLLGQLAVQYARLSGASRIIAIDTAQRRLDFAASHGATDVIKGTAAEAKDQVKAITATLGIDGADVVYDVTGHPAVLAQALPLARRFGKVVLLGDAGDPSRQNLTIDVITRGVRIVSAHDCNPPQIPTPLARWSSVQMHDAFLTWMTRGDIRVADLITNRFAPQQAAEAYEVLDKRRDEAMGIIFEWR
jgi:2-desacetyl-2-hydroxyethyl bacteriochlorophyllide A dehydrogenase